LQSELSRIRICILKRVFPIMPQSQSPITIIDHLHVEGLRRYVTRWVDLRSVPESVVIFLTAIIVGVGAGLGAILFRWLINGVAKLAYGGLAGLLTGISPIQLLIIPALGGAIYGPLIYFGAREAKGHGVPEVMEAVAIRGGRIRPRVAAIKSFASAICIGTGGSVGREGPIAQIGSAIGSTLGQLLNLSDERVRNLVACGAAGGIAATFNAPIAGAIFALEVILGQFHTTYFGAVVISAVVADVIAHISEGDIRAFQVPEYTLISPWELLLYALLGILAAVTAVAFTRTLYLSEDLWDKLRIPEYVKPVLGGLVLGAIGILSPKLLGYPRVFGVGYPTISQALSGQLALQVTAALLILKLLATITTLGAGGSGGIFAPSLFLGAMLGAAFGQVSNMLFPEITAPPGAYALVGMAAVFSGAAHAPITAIIMLFEMTNDYRIILPLMLTTVVATLFSRLLFRESIYTLKLTRRGVHLKEGKDIDVMHEVTVSEAMTTDLATVHLSMPLEILAKEFDRTHHHGFTVVDHNDCLAGVVTIQDLKKALESSSIEGKTVADIATLERVLVAYPDEPMGEALRRLAARDVGRLPVIERGDERRVVGALRRNDIIRAYNIAITKRADHLQRDELKRLSDQGDARFLQVEIPPKSLVVGKKVSEIRLPSDCLIISIMRGQKIIIAHGYSTLQAQDQLTVLANEECALEVQQRLTSELVDDDSSGEELDG
jgi:CIC family chloride channel protein